MKFTDAIDAYLADQRSYGRINSDRTEVSYRSVLNAHAQDVGNRDPRTIGREDVKRTLRRWRHPNTQRHAHAVLTSFYRWAMEEGIRRDNPAEQVRKAKKRPAAVYRLTRDEVIALMDASLAARRDRFVIHLGVLAGARNQELRGLQGRHFERPGWVWFSPDIAKGGRERWIPVLPELEPIVSEIRDTVGLEHHVIPARRPADPPHNTRWREYPKKPSSPQAIWNLVGGVAQRAGIRAHIHPHLLRHAYGDHVAKYAGLRAAQALLGHVSVDTTSSTYVDRPTLDELAVSVHGFRYRRDDPRKDGSWSHGAGARGAGDSSEKADTDRESRGVEYGVHENEEGGRGNELPRTPVLPYSSYPQPDQAAMVDEATTGIEPVDPSSDDDIGHRGHSPPQEGCDGPDADHGPASGTA